MDKVTICNNALIRIGAGMINSIDNDTVKEAILCKQIYPLALEELLCQHQWQFAMRTVALNIVVDPTFVSTYPYVFQIPSDCLLVVQCTAQNYVITGNKLETANKEVTLRYVARVDNPLHMPAYFREALVLVLALKLCTAITDNATMYQQLYPEAQAAVVKARFLDDKQRALQYLDMTNDLSDARAGRSL